MRLFTGLLLLLTACQSAPSVKNSTWYVVPYWDDVDNFPFCRLEFDADSVRLVNEDAIIFSFAYAQEGHQIEVGQEVLHGELKRDTALYLEMGGRVFSQENHTWCSRYGMHLIEREGIDGR